MVDRPTPCFRMFAQHPCEALEHCTFNQEAYMCIPKGNSLVLYQSSLSMWRAGTKPPCHKFHQEWACKTVANCTWNDAGVRCLAPGEVIHVAGGYAPALISLQEVQCRDYKKKDPCIV